MSDNKLKKEFKNSDVQRMRNIITKKYGDNTKIQSGYEKEQFEHEEGDTWEENGKVWTIKLGIKQNVSKLDLAKNIMKFPLLCPNCSHLMDINNDKKFWSIHGKCMNCVIEYETQLRIGGKYEEYEKNIIKDNMLNHLDTVKGETNDFINSDNSYITEDGTIENWSGIVDKEKMLQEVNEYIENIKSQIDK